VFLSRSIVALVLSASLSVPAAFASRVHRAPTSGSSKSGSKTKTTSTKPTTGSKAKNASSKSKSRKGQKTSYHRIRGQQSIAPDRATQIQQALIREHYLTGEPTGAWDASTISAMQKYQADQGWQTKLSPDPRALKKLGLGPDYSSAINAKEGTFVPPATRGTTSTEQASGFAAAAGVNE
jgi:hypothetical protein